MTQVLNFTNWEGSKAVTQQLSQEQIENEGQFGLERLSLEWWSEQHVPTEQAGPLDGG